jgi:GNAT superfamily N-acetyltransferase
MGSLAKSVLSRLTAEYRINWIFASAYGQSGVAKPAAVLQPSDAWIEALASSPSDQVRKSAEYARCGMAGYVIVEQDRPVCVAHFAEPHEYERSATWPLKEGEAALMDIATEEAERGRGLAVDLIRATSDAYQTKGHKRLLAFVWWSNTPSVRAFSKAGWRRIGLALEMRVSQHWLVLHIPFESLSSFAGL